MALRPFSSPAGGGLHPRSVFHLPTLVGKLAVAGGPMAGRPRKRRPAHDGRVTLNAAAEVRVSDTGPLQERGPRGRVADFQCVDEEGFFGHTRAFAGPPEGSSSFNATSFSEMRTDF